MKNVPWYAISPFIWILVVSSSSLAQQISFQIPVYNNELSTAFSALAQEEALYFLGPVSNGDDTEVALVKTDEQGQVLWTRTYGPVDDWKPYTTPHALHPNGRDIVSLLRWSKGSISNIRLLIHTADGELKADYRIPLTLSTFYLDGAALQGNQRCIYGTGFNGNQAHAWMALQNQWDDPIQPVLFETGALETLKRVKVIPSQFGGFIVALFVKSNVNGWIHLHRTDGAFNSVWNKKYFAAEQDPGFIGLAETRDTGLVFSMFQNSGNNQQPFATAITRIKKNGNIVWNYVFADSDKKVVTALSTDANDHVTGVGFSDYIKVQTNDFEKQGNAWHFGLDAQGKRLWSRQVLQNDKDYDGTFYGLLPAENGFYCFGDQAGKFDNHPTLFLDQDMWVINFDERGCWNGDCNTVINIPAKPVGVSAVAPALEVQLFPNPVADEFRIHGDEGVEYGATLLDIHGRVLSTWNPRITGSAYSLPAGLPSGAYWLRVWHQGTVQVLPLVILRP